MGYEGTVAVENVTADIERGDYVVVVGENGSGKSTLLRGILGLGKLRSGSIVFDDELSRQKIGYLPQQSKAQRGFPASVREVVLSGCAGRGGWWPFATKADRALAEEQMQRLGIGQCADMCYGELSGGQQQRVLLARALCATQSLLLLDEPVNGLDPGATAEFYDQIRRLNRELGVAVVMVSHDVGGALRDATKGLCMHQTMAFYGTTEAFRASHHVHELTGGEHKHEHH